MSHNTIICALTFTIFAAMAVPANSEAGSTAAKQVFPASQPGQVMVDMRLVQLNEPLIEMSLRGSQMTINHRPKEVKRSASDSERATAPGSEKQSGDPTITISATPPGKSNDLGITVISITDDATMKLGHDVLRLTRHKFLEAVDGTDSHAGKSAAWEVLAAPKILAEVGQGARITIGTTVPYMVQQDDGSLVVEYADDIKEGLSVELQIDQADENVVSFKDLSIAITRIAGRQEISGVPFDVGRPIIRSMKISTAMVLGADHVAIIQLPRATEENPPIFVFLTTQYIDRK